MITFGIYSTGKNLTFVKREMLHFSLSPLYTYGTISSLNVSSVYVQSLTYFSMVPMPYIFYAVTREISCRRHAGAQHELRDEQGHLPDFSKLLGTAEGL